MKAYKKKEIHAEVADKIKFKNQEVILKDGSERDRKGSKKKLS